MDRKLIQKLGEYGQNLSAAPNEFAIANVIALVISELETKPAPEAYMGYNLYDSNSNLYEQGKVILSKKARDKHEELIEKIAIKKDGYIETFLVNETSENVWFDQFRVMSTGPIIVQETHYDPWGLEIKELGYQYGGIKVNPYLYNGKEAIGHLGIELYDYGARMYDPVIGRWSVVDPMADQREWLSPYNYVQNNPMLRVDPDGMLDEYNFNVDTGEFDWISDKGGDERQYVNVVNNEGDLLGEGSVQGSEVYAYRLRESVVLTNFDAEFDDRSYNRENGYQYSSGDFQLRNEYRKTDNVFGRFIDKAEGAGKAVPISLREHEMKYGYLTSRLMMMGTAIESGLMLADPLGKPFSVGGSRYFSRTVGVSGSQGAKALTNANTGWNSFLKANTGKYSGAGWQRRAAADYYKSSSYKK
jgi:RHS repeat-associated protein